MNPDPAATPNTSCEGEDLNSYHIGRRQFDKALRYLPNMQRGLIEFLKSPVRTVAVSFPVEIDDGSVRTFTGYRVLRSRVRGPGKGGIRYHPDGTADEVRALAGWMTCGDLIRSEHADVDSEPRALSGWTRERHDDCLSSSRLRLDRKRCPV